MSLPVSIHRKITKLSPVAVQTLMFGEGATIRQGGVFGARAELGYNYPYVHNQKTQVRDGMGVPEDWKGIDLLKQH